MTNIIVFVFVIQMTLVELAKICGYGSNHMRVKSLFNSKKIATTIHDLVQDDVVQAVQKPRSDKLSGNPIWRKCWHQFTSVKKGQSFRCNLVKSERVKVNGKWLRNAKWERHPKRFMCFKMKQFREKVIAWDPYLEWRDLYLARNPKLSKAWHVSEKRLYKEKCFCVDEEEDVRKCGCEIHLKMSELTAALKRWRQKTLVFSKKRSHSCAVRTTSTP